MTMTVIPRARKVVHYNPSAGAQRGLGEAVGCDGGQKGRRTKAGGGRSLDGNGAPY